MAHVSFYRVSKRSAGMISSRFPGDIFTKIQPNLHFYRHLPAGSLTPRITLILFTKAIARLKDIYRGLIAQISINPGLQQNVFTGTLWSTRILSQPEIFQETLLISSRFPEFPWGKKYSSRIPEFPSVRHAVLLPPTHEPYLPLHPSRTASPFDWYSLCLLTEGWPGWADLGGWLHTEMGFYSTGSWTLDMVTHPSTNRARRRVTSLIETNVLPLSQERRGR